MKLLEKAAHLLGEEDPQGISFLWHLLGPLFVLLAYSLASQDPLLLGVGIFGLLLSARWQVRGFCYALVALAVLAIGEHGFFTQRRSSSKRRSLWRGCPLEHDYGGSD